MRHSSNKVLKKFFEIIKISVQSRSIFSDRSSMRGNSSFFIIFCLILTLGLVQAYQAFENYFSARGELQLQQTLLKKNLEQEKLKTALVANQFQDFRQSIAQNFPESSYEERNLLSAIRIPAQEKNLNSQSLMAGAKADFRDKNYTSAIAKLNHLLKKYPASSAQVEARFLLAESYFLLGELDSAIENIDLMTARYPDHPLTGHILLRLGQIYEARRRPAEARSVYHMIQENFKDQSSLVLQSKKNEGRVED